MKIFILLSVLFTLTTPCKSFAGLFEEFIEKSATVSQQLNDPQIRALAKTTTDFATLDGHYFESHEDTSVNAYREVLNDEYYPLLDNIVKLENGTIDQGAFFSFILNAYITNLKHSLFQATKAHEEDTKFLQGKKTNGAYSPGVTLTFFRDPGVTPHCEEFMQIPNSQLVRYWTPPGLRLIKDTKMKRVATAQFSQALQAEKNKMESLKNRVIPYRDAIEEFYNSLLHQAWRMIADPNLLPRKTKKILNAFSYLWPVLKDGISQTRGMDTLIKDCALSNSGELNNVFAIANSKARIKKTVQLASALYTPPLVLDELVTTKEDGNEAPIVEVTDAADKAILERETKTPPLSLKPTDAGKGNNLGTSPEVPEPKQGQELTSLDTLSSPATKTLAPIEEAECLRPHDNLFEEIREAKHIKHSQIVTLFKKLGGSLVRTKGSHETWEFRDELNHLITTFGFWKLHGKDHYGPWTKKLILDLQDQLI